MTYEDIKRKKTVAYFKQLITNLFSFPLEKVSRVRHLSLFERAPAAYVSGANFLS